MALVSNLEALYVSSLEPVSSQAWVRLTHFCGVNN